MSATGRSVRRYVLMTQDGMFFLSRFKTELTDSLMKLATFPTRQMAETIRDHRASSLNLVVRKVEVSVKFVN